jgi:hypothetical protein
MRAPFRCSGGEAARAQLRGAVLPLVVVLVQLAAEPAAAGLRHGRRFRQRLRLRLQRPGRLQSVERLPEQFQRQPGQHQLQQPGGGDGAAAGREHLVSGLRARLAAAAQLRTRRWLHSHHVSQVSQELAAAAQHGAVRRRRLRLRGGGDLHFDDHHHDHHYDHAHHNHRDHHGIYHGGDHRGDNGGGNRGDNRRSRRRRSWRSRGTLWLIFFSWDMSSKFWIKSNKLH